MKVTELVIRFHLAASPIHAAGSVLFTSFLYFLFAVENDRTSNRDKMNRIPSDVKLNILLLKLNGKRFLN